MPTFLVFKNAREVSRIRGADPTKLSEAVKKLAAEADSSSSSSGFGESSSSGGSGNTAASWITTSLPRGYVDVTSEVDVRGLDLLNGDSDFGAARVLFENGAPSALQKKKGGSNGNGSEDAKKEWVESDTDEQLMLYMPFQSTLKIHTLHLTSIIPSSSDGTEVVARPKTIKLYTNRAHVLGFEEAEGIPPTQTITLSPSDWDEGSHSAKVELRFVKFQNVSSLVVFVVDAEGGVERTRLDRVRIVGDTGEKRSMGKLEKVGEEH